MKIKKLILKNFKKFKDLEIIFKDLDCVVGTNNSGKSTILQALALFDFCLHQCLVKNNGKGFELKNRSLIEEDVVIFPFRYATDLWYNKKSDYETEKTKTFISISIEIIVIFENDKSVETNIELQSYNRFFIQVSTEIQQNWLEELHNFKISYLPVFSAFLPKEEKRTIIAIRNELARGNVSVVIRNMLNSLKEQNKSVELIRILINTFPFVKNLKIEFDEQSMQYIDVSYKEENATKEFDIFLAGSGFQQFIYLFGFILLESPNIILLDEPDVHLHGDLQKTLFLELQNLVENHQKQVIFATHARDLITSTNTENIIHLQNGTPKRLKLDYQMYQLLDNLGSLDNNQLIKLQEFKKILVVENRIDWEILEIFGEELLENGMMQQLRNRLTIYYAEGNPYKQDLPKFQKSLQQMFIEKGEAVKIFAICDRDYFPQIEVKSFLETRKNDKNYQHISYHIWQKNEIENYLLSEYAFLSFIKKTKNDFNVNIIKEKLEEWAELQKIEITDKLSDVFKQIHKDWNVSTCNEKAREEVGNRWENDKLGLVDAKKMLGKMSEWFNQNGADSFSVKTIAYKYPINTLPTEIKELFEKICVFAGINTNDK